jgi:hypothetical protein
MTSLTVTTTNPLPPAIVGIFYSVQFQATGGVPPYTWPNVVITSGPTTGFSFNSSTGVYSGTPLSSGVLNFSIIQVQDSVGGLASLNNAILSIVPIGGGSSNITSYSNLITSEHNQKPNFMNVVGVIVGAAADAVASTQIIQPSFNLNTAVGNQLDVLGLWIGQSRKIDNVLLIGFFGFSEVSTGLPDGLQETFGELTDASIGGIWFNLGQADSGSTILNDIAYLTILKAKIVKNQWNGTVSGIENALQFITGVACSVTDTGNLSLSINVPLPITPLEQALLESLDLIPRPAGVKISSITFAP